MTPVSATHSVDLWPPDAPDSPRPSSSSSAGSQPTRRASSIWPSAGGPTDSAVPDAATRRDPSRRDEAAPRGLPRRVRVPAQPAAQPGRRLPDAARSRDRARPDDLRHHHRREGSAEGALHAVEEGGASGLRAGGGGPWRHWRPAWRVIATGGIRDDCPEHRGMSMSKHLVRAAKLVVVLAVASSLASPSRSDRPCWVMKSSS